MNISPKSQQVLNALIAHVEGTSRDADGTVWGSVYLDNCRPEGMTDKAFRSHLASLAAKGYYRPVDGYAFGDVRVLGVTGLK